MPNTFYPITTAFIVNGQYVKGPYLADLNTVFFLLAFVTTALDENDNTVEVFEIHQRKPYASKNDVFVFRTGGQTLDELLTWLNANSVNVIEKYTGWKATDITIENKTPYKDILINSTAVNERELTAAGDTNLYLDLGLPNKDRKIITVEGDQTKTNGGTGYPGPGVEI